MAAHEFSKIGPGEEFTPTFEMTLVRRNMLGEPMGGTSYYIATNGARLAALFAQHRRKNPLPKKDKRRKEDGEV